MDHIPLIDQGFRQKFATKLYPGEEYDWKGFWGFPERLGWDPEYISLGFDHGQSIILSVKPRSRRQTENDIQDPTGFPPLLQSWLYDAMLHEVLGSRFELDEFYVLAASEDGSKDQILSTKTLESRIKGWELFLRNLPASEARERISNAMKCTSYVNKFMTKLSDRIYQHTRDYFARKSAGKLTEPDVNTKNAEDIQTWNMFYWVQWRHKILPESLEVSICVLGFTLEYAARSIYQKLKLGDTTSIDCPPVPSWYIPSSVRLFLAAKGHCPLSIGRFSPALGLIGACLASTVDHTSQKDDHRECDVKRCSADNIDPDDYIRKHSNDGCCCSDILDDTAWSTMLHIIESKGIPVVRVLQIDGDCPKLAFRVNDANDVQGYVAFSHVWADGRGNQRGNGLYLCHWLELQALAQNSGPATPSVSTDPFAGLVPFWFDVFCVPLKKSSPEVQALRRKAISMMTRIYRRATVVIILDSELKLLRPSSPTELGIHLSFSKWLRRLWTTHEGAVAKRIRVQTAIGAIHLYSQVDEIVNSTKSGASTWHVSSSQVDEIVNRFKPDPSPSQVDKIIELIESDTLPNTDAIIKGIGASESVSLWTVCLSAQFSIAEDVFRFAWNECRRRSTSVASDRYIVLGMLLNLDEDTLEAIQRSAQDRHDTDEASRAKWRAILKAQKEFPSAIIFNEGQKLSDPGFGWAPDSMDHPIVFDGRPAGILTEHGLRVIYQGMRLLSHPNWNIKFTMNALGPARTKPGEPGGRCAFVADISGDRTQRFRINIDSSKWNPTDTSLSPDANLAILLQPVARAKDPSSLALLVEQCRPPPGIDDEDGDIIFARVHTRLRWYKMTDEIDFVGRLLATQRPDEIINASWIADGGFQRWCIGV